MHCWLVVFGNICVGPDAAQTALKPGDIDGVIPVQDMVSVSSVCVAHIVVVALC